jgi:hypothetical protein
MGESMPEAELEQQGGPQQPPVTENTGEELESDAPVTSEEGGEEEEEEGEGKPSRLEKRFSELTGQRNAERLRAERAEQEAQELRRLFDESQARDPMMRFEAQKPRFEDFEDAGAFEQAYEQWITQRGQLQSAVQQQQQAQAEYRQKHANIYAQGSGKYPDFATVVGNPAVPDLSQVAPGAFGVLMESDHAADLAYKLAKEPAIVHELSRMSPVQQQRRIFQLEQSFTQPSTSTPPATPPTSSVPAGTYSGKDPSKMSMQEYSAMRAKQRKEKGFRH